MRIQLLKFIIFFLLVSGLTSCMGLIDEQQNLEDQTTEESTQSLEEIATTQAVQIPLVRTLSFNLAPYDLLSDQSTLASNKINDIASDSLGTIYIATDGGLTISDDSGASFKTLTVKDGLPTNHITSIFIDLYDNIYLATYGGGIAYSSDYATTFTVYNKANNGLPSNYVRTVHLDFYNFLYAVTVNPQTGESYGLSISPNAGGTFTSPLTTSDGLQSNEITDIYVTPFETAYFVSTQGLSITANYGSSFETKSLPGAKKVFIYIYDLNTIYVNCEGQGLAVSTDSGANFDIKDTTNGLPNLSVTDLFFSEIISGKIYVSTTQGVYYSNDQGENFISIITTQETPQSEYINHLTLIESDSDNSPHYFLASDKGLSFATAVNDFTNIESSHGLFSSNLSKVLIDGYDNLFVVTKEFGLGKSKDFGKSFEMINDSNGLPSLLINDFFIDTMNNLYVATPSGLSISTNSGRSFITKNTENGLPNNNITNIFVSDKGVIFVSAQDATSPYTSYGLSYSTDGGDNFSTLSTSDGLIDNYVTEIFITKNNEWLIGSTQGLTLSTDEGSSFFYRTQANDGLVSDNIRSLYVDEYRNIYIGTDNGISVSKDGSINFTTINSGNTLGIDSDLINDIYVDKNLTMFIATEKGLSISTDTASKNVNKSTNDYLGSNSIKNVLYYKNYIFTSGSAGLNISEEFSY